MSFLLVLVGTVLLVIGLLNSGLGLIYASIGATLLAAIVLAVGVMRSRPRAELAGEGPAPLAEPLSAPPPPPSAAATQQMPAATAPGGVAVLERDETTDDVWGTDEDDFPIADYDELRVSEILPLLDQLDADELEMVARREASGRNRSSVKARIEQLLSPAASAGEWEDVEGGEWEAPADEAGAPPVGIAAAAAGDGAIFPIADYDELKAGEITPLLRELDADELRMVRDREKGGQARATVLNRIDALLGAPAAAPAAAKKSATKKTPAKKAAASKSTAKKAAASKSTAKKAAAPAKKTAAKKATSAKKAASSTAKKAAGGAAKKAATKKTPAKKAPAKKAGAAKKR